jgi:hypothetical protein
VAAAERGDPAAAQVHGLMMANVKKGQTVRSPQWWRHLRSFKRLFWKRQRQDDKRSINELPRRGAGEK